MLLLLGAVAWCSCCCCCCCCWLASWARPAGRVQEHERLLLLLLELELLELDLLELELLELELELLELELLELEPPAVGLLHANWQ